MTTEVKMIELNGIEETEFLQFISRNDHYFGTEDIDTILECHLSIYDFMSHEQVEQYYHRWQESRT